MDEKKKSRTRAKKSIIALGDAAANTVVSTAIPILGGMVYGASKALVNHCHEYVRDRSNERIYNFFIAANLTEDEYNSCMKKEKATEDFYSILSSTIQDEEDSKVDIYAVLLKSIVTGKVQQNYKILFLKSVKEMNLNEIELIRKIYIFSEYQNQIQSRTTVENLTSPKNPIDNIAIQKLARLGFLEKHPLKNSYVRTKLLDLIVKAIFRFEDLLPEAIGQRTWLPVNGVLAKENIGINTDLLIKLQNIFQRNRIRINIISTKLLERQQSFLFNNLVVLLLEKKDRPNNFDLKLIKQHRSHLIIIKILLDDSSKELSDSLSEIDSDFEIKLTSMDKLEKEICKFANYINANTIK